MLSSILSLIFLLGAVSPVFAGPDVRSSFNDGKKIGFNERSFKAPLPRIEVKTTKSGVSETTVMPKTNLVYAIMPESIYLAGTTKQWVHKGMGDASFSGVSGWYRDPATGKLTHYGANEIPFEEHAGIYTVALASATTNYAIRSWQFDNVAWTKTRAGITLFGTDPAGTEKAMFLREDGTAANIHLISQTITESVFADNAIVTFSYYVKAGTRNWTAIRIVNKDNAPTLGYFNASTGALGILSGGSSFNVSEQTINGFYRLSATAMIGSAAANPQFQIYLADSDGGIVYNGDANSGLTIFGAMVSETPSAHPYLPTEGSAYVWAGNAGALTYQLDTMQTALDGTTNALSGASLWGEQLGAELPTAGDMNTACGVDWTCGGNWQISGSSAQVVPVGSSLLYQNVGFIEGSLYKVTFTISDRTAGTVSALMGTSDVYFQATIGSNGTFTYYAMEIAGGNGNFIFSANATFDGTIDTVSIKQVLNAWDSGDGHGLEPPHGTLIQAVRFTYDFYAEIPGANYGLLGVISSSASNLYHAGTAFIRTGDGTSSGVLSLSYQKDFWYWFVIEWAVLNSNVSQFRVCQVSGGLSCGNWIDYDGAYTVGSNLVYFYDSFGYVHLGPLLIYRSHLDSTFYDALGNGG